MKDETMAGYYQLLIAIFCNLNVNESRYLYEYGPAHPVCRRIMHKKLKYQKEGEGLSEKEFLGRLDKLEKKGWFCVEEKGA